MVALLHEYAVWSKRRFGIWPTCVQEFRDESDQSKWQRGITWRRMGDSNPRELSLNTLSKRAH